MSETALFDLVGAVLGAVGAVATGPLGTLDLPKGDERIFNRSGSEKYEASVFSHDNAFLGRVFDAQPSTIPLADIPQHFLDALVSVEDRRFFSHNGVDPLGMGSALLDSIRGDLRGGSTLTQQLIKNTIVGSEVSISRKIQEAVLATRLETSLDKSEILSVYLQSVYFGRGAWGVASAADKWFGKSWRELSIGESAFLAGLLQAPGRYDPLSDYDEAVGRRNTVLRQMFNNGMLGEEELSREIAVPLTVVEPQSRVFGSGYWEHLAARRDLDALSQRADATSFMGMSSVRLSIDKDWQRAASEALSDGVDALSSFSGFGRVSVDPAWIEEGLITEPYEAAFRGMLAGFVPREPGMGRAVVTRAGRETVDMLVDWLSGPITQRVVARTAFGDGYRPVEGDVLFVENADDGLRPHLKAAMQAAIVVMRAEDGALLASVGSLDASHSFFDYTTAQRQPGSAIKPFVWMAALEAGFSETERVPDMHQGYRMPSGEIWRPRNYDGSQRGRIPLFQALEISSNQVSAYLGDAVGLDRLSEVLAASGVYPGRTEGFHPTAVLGTAEVELRNLVAGFAAIANGGYRVQPHSILTMLRNDRVAALPWRAERSRIARPETVESLSRMLAGVVARGTAARAFRGMDLPFAGKTGTTQEYRDAWFVGFTRDVAIGVWIGRDDPEANPVRITGGSAAAPVVRTLLDAALAKGMIDDRGLLPGRPAVEDWHLLPVGVAAAQDGSNAARIPPGSASGQVASARALAPSPFFLGAAQRAGDRRPAAAPSGAYGLEDAIMPW